MNTPLINVYRTCSNCKFVEPVHGSQIACSKYSKACSDNDAIDCKGFSNGQLSWPMQEIILEPFNMHLLVCIGAPADKLMEVLTACDVHMVEGIARQVFEPVTVRTYIARRTSKPVRVALIRFESFEDVNAVNGAIAASIISMHIADSIALLMPNYHEKHTYLVKYIAETIIKMDIRDLIKQTKAFQANEVKHNGNASE